jgi:uncharacterized membrane protein YjfL (UPF0719 family)
MNHLFLSLAQLAVATVLSVLAAYLAFFLFQQLTRGLDEWEALRGANPAVGLVLGAIIVSVAIVLRPALAFDSSAWDAGSQVLLQGLLVQGLQLVIGLILAVFSVVVAVLVFAALTRGLDEMSELRKGNLAVAGLLAGLVLGVALMVSQAMAQVMHALATLLL